MTLDDAKKHFDLTPCPNKVREFVLFNRLFHIQIADDVWAKLDSELRLNKSYFLVGSVEDFSGMTLYRVVFGKLSITWGKLS